MRLALVLFLSFSIPIAAITACGDDDDDDNDSVETADDDDITGDDDSADDDDSVIDSDDDDSTADDDTTTDDDATGDDDSTDDDDQTGDDVEIEFCQGSATALFDPVDGMIAPFPNDLWTAADPESLTGVKLDFSNVPSGDPLFDFFPSMQKQFEALDGFGPYAAIQFSVDKSIDFNAWAGTEIEPELKDEEPDFMLSWSFYDFTAVESPEEAVVVLIEFDRSGALVEPIPCFVEYLEQRRGGTPEDPGALREDPIILLEPLYPMKPGATYIAALTTKLVDMRGDCVGPSEQMIEVLSGDLENAYGRLGEQAPEAINYLTTHGFIEGPADLASLTVFTTQTIREELEGARLNLEGYDFAFDPSATEIVDQQAEELSGELHGALTMPEYRADGVWQIEGTTPVEQAKVPINFELMLPDPTTAETQPPYPVIVYMHGLMGDKGEMGGLRRKLAKAGFASISIDAVGHGDRNEGQLELNELFAVDLETGQFDMAKARDNFRQTVADEMAQVRALEQINESLPGLGLPQVDPGKVYVLGHSLGGILVGTTLGADPIIGGGVINVGGGGLLNILLRSKLFGMIIETMRPRGTTALQARRTLPLTQMLFERGDPVNYGRYVFGFQGGAEAVDDVSECLTGEPKSVLFQQVEADTLVPNHANEALARSLGLPMVGPATHAIPGILGEEDQPVENNLFCGTGGITQFDHMDGDQPATHGELISSPEGAEQIIHFFETLRDNGVGEIIHPYEL